MRLYIAPIGFDPDLLEAYSEGIIFFIQKKVLLKLFVRFLCTFLEESLKIQLFWFLTFSCISLLFLKIKKKKYLGTSLSLINNLKTYPKQMIVRSPVAGVRTIAFEEVILERVANTAFVRAAVKGGGVKEHQWIPLN